jgi:glycerol dehydrogenase
MRGHFLVQKYIQGPGVLSECGPFLPADGGNLLLLADRVVMPIVFERMKKSAADAKLEPLTFMFGGESSEEEIERVKKFSTEKRIRAIAGAGGGKALDTARMVSYHLKTPMISVPTIAATNAATSSLAGIYSEDHVYRYPVKIGKCPDLVLVDTEVIAQAPVRYLVAGMGDGLSTVYEGRAMKAAGKKTVHGTDCNETCLTFSRLAHDTILEKGYLAKIAAENQTASPALEDVVEAILFLSEAGAEGGGGTAVSHGLNAALTILPEVREVYHGERVAFGILVQLILENRSLEEILTLQRFFARVGLPLTLKEIRIADGVREKIQEVVRKACEPGRYVHNMPFPISEASLFGAIMTADTLGRKFRLGENLPEKEVNAEEKMIGRG